MEQQQQGQQQTLVRQHQREYEETCQRLKQNDNALTQLSVFSRLLSDDNDAIFLSECLKGNTSLQSLSLQIGFNMTVDGARELLDGLFHSHVTTLKLTGRNMTDSDVLRTLFVGIQQWTTLRQLTLMDFWVGLDEFGAILAAPVLQRVTVLSRWARHLRPMCESLAGHASLTKLELTSLGHGFQDVDQFIKYWPKNSTLQELSLERNFLTSRGVQLLLEATIHHPALESLDVSGNTGVQPDGLQATGRWLAVLTLKRLMISNCNQLGHSRYGGYFDYHGRELLQGMECNLVLQELDVSFNGLPESVERQLHAYTTLNQRGPNLVSIHDEPPTLWCHYFARLNRYQNTSRVYYYLREHPDLVRSSFAC